MKRLLLASTLAFTFALTSTVFAAGESSGGSTGASSGASNNSGGTNNGGDASQTMSPKKLKCKKGEIIKTVKKDGKSTKMCVKAAAGLVPDGELYDQGRMLAKEGEYDWALQVLALIEDQNQPRVLNYTGYSHRKAGRIDIGISYYEKALAIDPNFVLAREYLGEGYVAAGRIDLAKVQLDEIAKRAGTDSEEFVDLNKAIHDATM